MVKKMNPAAERSKKSMASALVALMEEKDYASISIQEICNQAQLARQTFYTNFSSKEEILFYYMDLLFDQFRGELSQNRPQTAREIVKEVFEFCERQDHFVDLLCQQKLSHLLVRRLSVYSESLWNIYIFPEPMHGPGEEQVRKYRNAFFVGAVYNVMLTWFASEKDISPKKLSDLMVRMMEHAFDTQPASCN